METTTKHIATSQHGAETHYARRQGFGTQGGSQTVIACGRRTRTSAVSTPVEVDEIAATVTCRKCAGIASAEVVSPEAGRADRYEAIAAKHRNAGEAEEAEAWERSAAAWREA